MILLAQIFAAYILAGLFSLFLFKKEIVVREKLTMYNHLMGDRNSYHYLYLNSGRTISVILILYLPFYLFLMRRFHRKLLMADNKGKFLEEVDAMLLANKDSPEYLAIRKKQQ